MTNVQKLSNSLPSSKSTKMALILGKLKTTTVEYYSGRDLLVDLNNPVLDKNNTDLEKKFSYFETLDYRRRQAKYLKLLALDNICFDILLGHDISLKMPIKCVVCYIKIGKFVFNFENVLFFEFLEVLELTGDSFSLLNVKAIR